MPRLRSTAAPIRISRVWLWLAAFVRVILVSVLSVAGSMPVCPTDSARRPAIIAAFPRGYRMRSAGRTPRLRPLRPLGGERAGPRRLGDGEGEVGATAFQRFGA